MRVQPTPSEDAHGNSLLHFPEHALERQVVAVMLKDPAFAVGAVQDVIHENPFRKKGS